MITKENIMMTCFADGVPAGSMGQGAGHGNWGGGGNDHPDYCCLLCGPEMLGLRMDASR
jgi:hypothetical protein